MTSIYTTPVCKMTSFNNLFIELTGKNCNQRCKHCYIDFPLNKNVKDFISVDTIKKALKESVNEPIECIYLTGAEPMTHPDFNSILRMCLKRTNVCICTNASFINEKKARFLKRVEGESNYEIIFKLSIDHYDEIKNDDIRSRGSYRQVLHAIKSLIKYGFNPIISVTDYYNEGKNVLISNFKKVFSKIGFEANDNNFKINIYCYKNKPIDTINTNEWTSTDCQFGRIITSRGIYTCPFLANDHRGRSGSSLKDFSRKNSLETNFCATCMQNKEAMFSINFELFQ